MTDQSAASDGLNPFHIALFISHLSYTAPFLCSRWRKWSRGVNICFACSVREIVICEKQTKCRKKSKVTGGALSAASAKVIDDFKNFYKVYAMSAFAEYEPDHIRAFILLASSTVHILRQNMWTSTTDESVLCTVARVPRRVERQKMRNLASADYSNRTLSGAEEGIKPFAYLNVILGVRSRKEGYA